MPLRLGPAGRNRRSAIDSPPNAWFVEIGDQPVARSMVSQSPHHGETIRVDQDFRLPCSVTLSFSQKRFLRLKGLRKSDKSGYFLVYDGTTNVALPPKKELQGKDLAGLKDKNNVMIVQEMRDKAKSGGGFVYYIWSKPGAGDTRKLTYAEMIPGTSMWIGTGVYLDNIDAYQVRMASEIGSMVSRRTAHMVLVSGIIFAAIIALCLFIAFGIVRSLKEMVVSFQDIAEGEGDLTKRIKIASKDEIAELAGWFNTFLEKLQAMIRKIADNATHVDRSSTKLSEIANMMSHGAGETSGG